MRHFDIDPTIQDWGVAGHYDYDEFFDTIRANILREYPDAKITREQYIHVADCTVLDVDDYNFDASEFYSGVESCEWLGEHPLCDEQLYPRIDAMDEDSGRTSQRLPAPRKRRGGEILRLALSSPIEHEAR
jgi:hypothetical protein